MAFALIWEEQVGDYYVENGGSKRLARGFWCREKGPPVTRLIAGKDPALDLKGMQISSSPKGEEKMWLFERGGFLGGEGETRGSGRGEP